MTFLALTAQKSLLTLQKSHLEFEQLLVSNQVGLCQKQMNRISKQYTEMYGDDADAPSYDEDPFFLDLKQMEEELETKQQDLGSQITLLDQQIQSTKTLVQNNIKSGCGLNLLGS